MVDLWCCLDGLTTLGEDLTYSQNLPEHRDINYLS